MTVTVGRPVRLEDRYALRDREIYLSGLKALVRIPIDQHRLDRRNGLDTATFVSGYEGSPLAGSTRRRHKSVLPGESAGRICRADLGGRPVRERLWSMTARGCPGGKLSPLRAVNQVIRCLRSPAIAAVRAEPRPA